MPTLTADDRLAITDVLYHYSYCLDSGQRERLGEVFSADADVDYGYKPWLGLEETIAGIGEQLDRFDGTQHSISNVRVFADDDQVKTTAYLQGWHWVLADGADQYRPAEFMFGGVYLDQFRLEPDGWRVSRRRFRRLGPSALTSGAMPAFMRPRV